MNIEEQILWCRDIAEKSKYLIEHGINDETKRIGKESSEKYRQYAKWLEELKRSRVLLKATHELLMKQNDSGYVLNLLGETVFYDDAECDGSCLMEDIEYLMEEWNDD